MLSRNYLSGITLSVVTCRTQRAGLLSPGAAILSGTFLGIQRLSIALVCQDYLPGGECGVHLGEGKDDLVAVRRLPSWTLPTASKIDNATPQIARPRVITGVDRDVRRARRSVLQSESWRDRRG